MSKSKIVIDHNGRKVEAVCDEQKVEITYNDREVEVALGIGPMTTENITFAAAMQVIKTFEAERKRVDRALNIAEGLEGVPSSRCIRKICIDKSIIELTYGDRPALILVLVLDDPRAEPIVIHYPDA
jgi:hypothetical protein